MENIFTIITLIIALFTSPVIQEINIHSNIELVRVVDGDTVIAEVDGVTERIRIIGLDSPESAIPDTEPDCYGSEAHDYLEDLFSKGTEIRIELDENQGSRDIYKRLLAHVFIDDINVSENMIQNGYAYTYVFGSQYTYKDLYLNAQEEAQEQQRGLWSPQTCNGNRE